MGTKADPGEFDCYGAAATDEPVFILRANDPLAPAVVEAWAARYLSSTAVQYVDPEHRERKYRAALQCAADMREWVKRRKQR